MYMVNKTWTNNTMVFDIHPNTQYKYTHSDVYIYIQWKQTDRRCNHLVKINVYYLVNLKGIHKPRFLEHNKVGQSFLFMLCFVTMYRVYIIKM